MYAYSQVDPTVRRKLEEMLKTWREPVPGSLATTPVFPPASTQPIVDSLNRYRASSTPQPRLQQQQPPRPVETPYRNTPTPPIPVQYPQASYPPNHMLYAQYGTQIPQQNLVHQVKMSFSLKCACVDSIVVPTSYRLPFIPPASTTTIDTASVPVRSHPRACATSLSLSDPVNAIASALVRSWSGRYGKVARRH